MTYIGEIIGEPEVLDASLFMTQPWRTFLSWSWAAVVVTDGCQDLAWQGADELAQRASDDTTGCWAPNPDQVALAAATRAKPDPTASPSETGDALRCWSGCCGRS